MAHAEICPICKGKGKVKIVAPEVLKEVTTDMIQGYETCHGCGGKGWITVGAENPFLDNDYKNTLERITSGYYQVEGNGTDIKQWQTTCTSPSGNMTWISG